jgi:diguanylate cyclase (GGDEF)-like protein
MKYKSRIIAVSIVVVNGTSWTYIHYLATGAFHCIEVAATLSYALLAWLLSGYYDRSKQLIARDYLTALYTRRYVYERFPKLSSDADRRGCKIGIMVIDVNDFKKINDTHGHKAGDNVLKTISLFLSDTARSSDIVSRWGGDEFVVILPQRGKPDMDGFLQRFSNKLSQLPHSVNVSVGSAVYPDHSTSLDDLLDIADKNMYSIKKSRREVY